MTERSEVYVNFVPLAHVEPVKRKVLYVTSGVCHFFNSQHLLYKLSRGARAFYDFLCEVMNNDNNVTIDVELKMKFVRHFTAITGAAPVVESLPKCIKTLESLGLIISMGTMRSGFFCVNPKYAFKGSKAKRLTLLRVLIESRGRDGLPLHGLIDLSESIFLLPTNKLIAS